MRLKVVTPETQEMVRRRHRCKSSVPHVRRRAGPFPIGARSRTGAETQPVSRDLSAQLRDGPVTTAQPGREAVRQLSGHFRTSAPPGGEAPCPGGLGEHTAEAPAEAGYSPAEIERSRGLGAVT